MEENVYKLELPKESRLKQAIKFMHNHKLFSTACISFIVFTGINFYLIFNFMKILENV